MLDTQSETGTHGEMLSFVTVMIAILLCSTLMDGPKRFMINMTNVLADWVRNVTFRHLEKTLDAKLKRVREKATDGDKKPNLFDVIMLTEASAFGKFEAVHCGLFSKRVNLWHQYFYRPTSMILATIWVAMLFYGVTNDMGYYNVILVAPLAFYLFVCVICFLIFIWNMGASVFGIYSHGKIEAEFGPAAIENSNAVKYITDLKKANSKE